MTKQFDVRYSFVISVEAENHQDAVNKANEIAKENIEKYGPGCVDAANWQTYASIQRGLIDPILGEECSSSYGLTPTN